MLLLLLLLLLLLILLLLSGSTESIIKGLWWAGFIYGMEGMRYTFKSVKENLDRKSSL
jgi:membrane-associated PAP2 superfamily phosphatase